MTTVSEVLGPASFAARQLPLRQLEKPTGNDVHLWHLDFDKLSSPLGSGDGVQSHRLAAVQQRATRRFYLRLILGAYLGLPGKDIQITRGSKGRPDLSPEHYWLSRPAVARAPG